MKSLKTIKQEVLKLNKTTQPIDDEILDLLIGLKSFNIPTQQSCSGHKDKLESFPFVDIHDDDSHIKYDDFSPKMVKIKKKWIKQNVLIQEKLISLLTEFYATRKVDYKYQISLHTMIDWSWVRLKSIGADLLQNMTTKNFEKELPIYQNEMNRFASFLIKKYLEN